MNNPLSAGSGWGPVPPVVAGLALLIGGCASQAPVIAVAETPVHQRLTVPTQTLVIIDLVPKDLTDQQIKAWSSGFQRLPDSSTVPSFAELVRKNLEGGIAASNETGKGALELTLLNANLLVEMRTADSLVFAGIFSSLSERKYMCRLDASFRYADRSSRKILEVLDSRSRHWGDLSADDKALLVTQCISQLVRDVVDYSSKVVASVK